MCDGSFVNLDSVLLPSYAACFHRPSPSQIDQHPRRPM
nr:MAG TPA: hypothetical protein [Caudoviricetes sp.]